METQLEIGKKICRQIESLGYKALIVGGAVRDSVMGEEPHDIDLATNCPISTLTSYFPTYDIGNSKDFGIVVVTKGGFSFEIAQFRTDGEYDGRRPTSIETVGSFRLDAARRDFTINAMGMTADGEIIDYFGGKEDLHAKIVRTVGDPAKRFGEDKLRLLRLPRFAAKQSFTIEKNTKRTAKKMAKGVNQLSKERVKDELVKAAGMGGKRFANYIQMLVDLKLLREVLPEVDALRFMPESRVNHPESSTTFGHTLKALEAALNATPMELIAILVHDIGKACTHSIKNGKHAYHRHEKVGAVLVDGLARRLKFSNKERELLVFTTANHMRFHRITEMKPSKVGRLIEDPNFNSLIVVCGADSFHNTLHHKVLERVEEIKDRLSSTKSAKDLVTGTMIMETLGIKPGKEVGRIKKVVNEFVVDHNTVDLETIIAKIKEVA